MALTNFNQSVNCNAQSMIGDKVALYMNASIPQEGSISINQSIQDRVIYFANEAECKADYAAFSKKVEDIAKSLAE